MGPILLSQGMFQFHRFRTRHLWFNFHLAREAIICRIQRLCREGLEDNSNRMGYSSLLRTYSPYQVLIWCRTIKRAFRVTKVSGRPFRLLITRDLLDFIRYFILRVQRRMDFSVIYVAIRPRRDTPTCAGCCSGRNCRVRPRGTILFG